jgi:4-hydroxybenzoate polyprenyltransferase
MAPPLVVVPGGMLKFFVVYWSLQALAGRTPLSLGHRVWLGAITLSLVMILMRVYDELKDLDSDLKLGRAGDPRYKDRALVRGAVLPRDIRALRNLLVVLLWVVNLALLSPIAISAFAVLFLVLWLSSRWFFYPAIARSLALAFVTHNPITLVLGGYIVAVFVADYGVASVDAQSCLLVLLSLWIPVAAWELSRKVRIPEDETDYETYSRLFGWKTAALLPVLSCAAAAATLAALARLMQLPPWYSWVLVAAASLVALGSLRLLLWPSSRSSKLEPYTRGFAALTDLGLFAALLSVFEVSLP